MIIEGGLFVEENELSWDRSRLDQIKRNTKNSYQYIQKVEKEYLKGNTLVDKKNYIDDFAEIHSWEDVEYLSSDLHSIKENNVRLVKGFFDISIPVYAILFSIFISSITIILTFSKDTLFKSLDERLSDKLINDNLINFTNFLSESIYFLAGTLFLLFFTLLALFFIYNLKSSRCESYISFLNYIKNKEEKK